MEPKRESTKETPAADGVKEEAIRPSQFDWDTPQYPSDFDFDKNPVCEGTVTKVGAVTVKGREATFINVETPDGEFTVWAGIVLSGKIVDEPIERGDIIGIKYLGKETGKKGLLYKNYDVRVVKPAV